MEGKEARPRDVRATVWNGHVRVTAVRRRRQKTGGMETRREEEAVAMCGVDKHASIESSRSSATSWIDKQVCRDE